MVGLFSTVPGCTWLYLAVPGCTWLCMADGCTWLCPDLPLSLLPLTGLNASVYTQTPKLCALMFSFQRECYCLNWENIRKPGKSGKHEKSWQLWHFHFEENVIGRAGDWYRLWLLSEVCRTRNGGKLMIAKRPPCPARGVTGHTNRFENRATGFLCVSYLTDLDTTHSLVRPLRWSDVTVLGQAISCDTILGRILYFLVKLLTRARGGLVPWTPLLGLLGNSEPAFNKPLALNHCQHSCHQTHPHLSTVLL